MIEADPLEVAGWRMVTGELRAEHLPELATDALVRGLDSPSLRILAGQNPADVRDSADLFMHALDELGFTVPAPDEAAWSLARTTAQQIVDGVISPAAGANEIWRSAFHRVEDSGDLRIFVGLASTLDDHPEDPAVIELEIVAAAKELLQRSRPRRWLKLMAQVGRSPLSRTAGENRIELDPADLPIRPELVAEIEAWAAEHLEVLREWPRIGGFESEEQAEVFVQQGERLAAQVQAAVGADYHVEYMPEAVRPPGVKLSSSHRVGTGNREARR
ncbi:hypothetical protein [Virgisporangium aurantiacum]|uniref:hypothetical protein n=1 Tax=Virgisporangium aurantiacum TaxID=175570 RepID=UPI001951F136|nr:hypothetical protein [Virgisporangium aurantiacum]